MVILLSLMMISVNGFGAAQESQESEEVKCPRKVKILVKEIKGTDFSEYSHFSAEFKPESIEVKAVVSGKVTELKVSEGDLVSRDWVIAVIDNALADQIKTQEDEVNKWQRTLKARQNWKERSERAEAQAERKIEEASARLEELKANAEDRMIKSPVSGQIRSLSVEKDAEVGEGAAVAVVVNDKKMLAVTPVDEEDKTLFSEGQQISLEPAGEITAVVVAVDEGDVTLAIDNSDKKLGGVAALEFKRLKKEYQDVVVLPKGKILQDEGGSFVYTVADKIAKKSYLKVGPVEDNKALILEGLLAGDYLICAEILSPKEGTLREEFVCIEDGVKIAVMEKDPESGQFKKAKRIKMAGKAVEEEPVEVVEEKEEIKKEEVVEEKKEEVAEEPVEEAVGRNYFSFGLGAGYVSKTDENFKDVYGGGFSGLFHLSYNIKGTYEIFFEIAYYKKSGMIETINLESELLMVPLYLGGKYVFNTGRIKPYLGLAWAVFNVKETNDFRSDTNYHTTHGVSLLGGAYFSLGKKFDLFGGLRYDIGKVTIEEFNEEADLAGIRFHLGFLYNF
jgi:RND family efflux transporter MFP subunit